MPKYKARRVFLWKLIAKNRKRRLALHTSLFSSNTEHLLQVGNSHLKHLYLVFMKHEKHISITLCDVSNDFRYLAIPGHEIVFLQRMLVRGGELRLPDAVVSIFVTFAQSITFESIIL